MAVWPVGEGGGAGFYPDPPLVLEWLAALEPFRPLGRKGLDSEVMTMLGIRPRTLLVT